MNLQQYLKPALVVAGLFAVYKWAPNNHVKGAVLGVGGMVIARQIPYVKDVI